VRHKHAEELIAARICDALARMTGPDIGCCVLPILSGRRPLREEEPIVANAVESRRREFATGRACARTALAEVGCPPSPILRGPFGEPVWPRGFAGSITHDNGFAAAIAYPTEYPGHLGIDLLDRPDLTIFTETASTFLTPTETRNIIGMNPWHIAKVFSAKEAAIKILSTRRQMFMDFRAIESSPTAQGLALYVLGGFNSITATFAEVDGTLVTLATERNVGAGENGSPSAKPHKFR
jgi:4'-phosphopantetheinyl transferase EntD